MKIEILIYSYLAIGASMIVFNIVCTFWFKHNKVRLAYDSGRFEKKIIEQIKRGFVDEEHRNYIIEKLDDAKYLMAFDNTLEKIHGEYSEEIEKYFKQLVLVFAELTRRYSKKDEIKAAYFPYIIYKYGLFKGEDIKSVNDSMFSLVRSKSVYCRENALHALYSIGNENNVLYALTLIDTNDYYHHNKLVTDGLMNFAGDKEKLDELLWKSLSKFSVEMQTAILDYLRFSGARFDEGMLSILCSDADCELRYSAIRYFGKNYYEPAYEVLMDIVENTEDDDWEYLAITALSLVRYKSERTIDILKKMLSNKNWYVRYNSSIALEKMGLGEEELKDILNGNDRFARDIVNYRLEQKRLREMEMSEG